MANCIDCLKFENFDGGFEANKDTHFPIITQFLIFSKIFLILIWTFQLNGDLLNRVVLYGSRIAHLTQHAIISLI